MSTMLMISPLRLLQRGRGRLREEQRRFEIAAHQIVPGRRRDLADLRRIKRRGIVHEHVERAEAAHRELHERRQFAEIEQVGLE